LLTYNPAFDWATNIGDLASKLESTLRERTKTRETIAPFPVTNNAQCIEMNEQELANFDKETQVIAWKAAAAREGYLWFDEETLRIPTVALDGETQLWRREAQKRGKIVRPEEYFESSHTFTDEAPLVVRRGAYPGIPSADPQSGLRRV